ncbi:acyltransferase family protein [Pokkaliibacter sp. CJK22405]|uniref:acyltransferase family protein n=1 Tax=Pokkaliibacter sp. CJK22405 TaxID=3384615 RepID=UPI0039851A76
MQRNIALDTLKLTLALMVIGLHTGFMTDISQDGAYLLIQGLFRIAVPVFFIINGFFFWQHRESPAHWFKRLALLYAVWMLIYSAFWVPDMDSSATLASTLFFGYYHLWYLPATLVAALVVYLCRARSVTLMVIMAVGCLAVGTTLQYGMSYDWLDESWQTLMPDHTTLYRNGLFFGLPFFLMGVLIRRCQLHRRLSDESVQTAVVVGLLLLLGENTLNEDISNGHAGFDLLLSLAVLCPALFVFALQRAWLSDNRSLGSYSNALYFVHPALLMLLQDFTPLKATPLTLAVTLLSLVASAVIMKLNRRVGVML